MSYYVIVQDRTPLPGQEYVEDDTDETEQEEVEPPKSKIRQILESDLRINWVMVLIVLYIFLITVIGLFYSRARDIEDFMQLT